MKQVDSGKTEATKEVKQDDVCVDGGETAEEIHGILDKTRAESAGLQVSSGKDAGKDAVDVDKRLERFENQYRRLTAEHKALCTWNKVRARLLNNNGRYLALADKMNLGGVLFGVDIQGNPLFADDGEEPIMTDLNYGDTRKKVYLNDPQGQWEADNMSGYEMFPYAGGEDGYDKSYEILAFERFTEKPFVVSPNRDEWRSSWLESGENPTGPRRVVFHPDFPDFAHTRVYGDDPESHSPARGVRRLLRVKES